MPGEEIAYIDESYDQSKFVLCALIVPMHAWRESFTRLQEQRRRLKTRHGIFTSVELHATEFVAGRGRIAPTFVPKALRASIFRNTIRELATMPGLALIIGCWELKGSSHNLIHPKAFSRIQERLQRRSVAQDSRMILVMDEGKEAELRRVSRRSKLWNPVGSQYGSWEDGSSYKNIPNQRLVEDPFFKSSSQSYFLQVADFVAFALLKSEVPPTGNVSTHALDTVFDELEPICVNEASRKDPRNLGIVRT